MINNISWASYWYALSLTLIGYYFLVFSLYYRMEFAALMSRLRDGKNGNRRSAANEPANILTSNQNQPSAQPDLLASSGATILPVIVQSAMEELEAFFTQAAQGDWTKDDLIIAVQIILRKYPAVKDLGFTTPVNTFINLQAELDCSIHLTDEDKAMLWM